MKNLTEKTKYVNLSYVYLSQLIQQNNLLRSKVNSISALDQKNEIQKAG